MILEAKPTQDPRLNEVLELILQITSGNIEARGTPSERNDEFDAIITGLNMLGEEMSAAFNQIGEARDRLEKRVKERTVELEKSNKNLATLVNDLETRSREMILLTEMGSLLQTSLTSDEACAVIKQSGQEMFPDWSGALYMYNASRNLLEARAAWGEALRGEDVFAPGECRALRSGRIFWVDKMPSGLTCQHVGRNTKLAENISKYMCVPMMAQGDTIGVLHLQTPLESEQLSAKQPLAEAISEQIALALANLSLQETLKRQSIRDPLTGLFNRRYLEESFERELSRAVRKQHMVGVIMFDIDHFKEFNDTHGHDAGDAVLHKLGTFLLEQFRGEDIACRYGGEEFTLILPEVTLDSVRERANSLREAVKQLDVYHHGKLLSKFTLSLGIAVFPDKGTDPETLLRAADQALYLAKQEGRDRVVVA